MYAVDHAVISVEGKHLTDRIGEQLAGLDGSVKGVDTLVGELDAAENNIGRGCDFALELRFDGQGDMWRGRDRWGARFQWGFGYRWRQCDRWG